MSPRWAGAVGVAFPVWVLGLLALTSAVPVPGIPRYDAVLLGCLAWQAAAVALGAESRRELGLICVFHALGVGLEWHKTTHGGWSYPEPSWLRLGPVPLYSGFMYASVASFLLGAWKVLDLRLTGAPPAGLAAALGLAIYGNFLTNVWLPDLKLPLLVGVGWLFRRGRVEVAGRGAPLLPMFPALGLALWLAECWATWFGAWVYPRQLAGWTPVPPDKVVSWTALVVVSFLLVARAREDRARPAPAPAG